MANIFQKYISKLAPGGIHRHGGEHTFDSCHCRSTCNVTVEFLIKQFMLSFKRLLYALNEHWTDEPSWIQTCNPDREQSALRLWGRRPGTISFRLDTLIFNQNLFFTTTIMIFILHKKRQIIFLKKLTATPWSSAAPSPRLTTSNWKNDIG